MRLKQLYSLMAVVNSGSCHTVGALEYDNLTHKGCRQNAPTKPMSAKRQRMAEHWPEGHEVFREDVGWRSAKTKTTRKHSLEATQCSWDFKHVISRRPSHQII